MKRVAFAGASGTGKTMLMMHVQEKYGLAPCPVGSRSVAKEMGFNNPYDVDGAGKRMEFQQRLFEAKRRWEDERDEFVTDRTSFDNLVYTMLDGDAKLITPTMLQAYADSMRRYTFIFFLPVRAFQNLGDDPHRVRNPAYHQLFDTVLAALITTYRARVCWLGKPESRISIVDRALGGEP